MIFTASRSLYCSCVYQPLPAAELQVTADPLTLSLRFAAMGVL